MSTKSPESDYPLGYWIRFVSNHVAQSFRQRIAPFDLTPAEWVALRSIGEMGTCGTGALSEYIGINAGATSRLIESLCQKEFVSRRIDSGDRRAVTLEVTPAGRKLFPKVLKEANLLDENLFGFLASKDRDRLRDILQEFAKVHSLKEMPTG